MPQVCFFGVLFVADQTKRGENYGFSCVSKLLYDVACNYVYIHICPSCCMCVCMCVYRSIFTGRDILKCSSTDTR